ncbi:DNA mismatch repair protein domain protein [Theileria parva strain Muguga]|uniref:DNA mismatch repair protein PMS1, putative n=1 Tax=Theileria parva TaxID=5875 RepID=Q4MZM5_THEPA|nr:DNA mismatch repair protein domain protein [Theileria parva strain Muguga]EAN31236.1 DNA mismatch repair protein domain protein [Theileria parva strain Muguga]|eukprot:XP_763519.1 DNA mismatch repair protein PMS1 [Theileria parva strain Muguga]
MSLQSLDHQQSCISRSFQVITGISCVIRELVENAIDAQATNIEIKIYNGGADLIKVADNGTGISEINFTNLASKHSTSKIRTFEDLFTSLTTFGFRGEALYSMCNLGNVEIETRTPSSDNGWLLRFDSLGNITSKTPIASNIGTCVKVRELFGEYPVRRKMLIRNSKNQISKSVSQIQQYALINPHISFNFTTVTNNKKFSNIFATSGSKDNVRGVIEEIFGHEFAKKLVQINIKDKEWRIEGLVSNPYNERGYREMEYFYINKRPISKVQKFKNAISAIFSHFSSKSKPSFILNLTMNYDHIDVNISPDKRSAYIYSEDYIIRTFKVSFYAILLIENLYEILKPKTSNLSQINSEILTQFISDVNVKHEEKSSKRELVFTDTINPPKKTNTSGSVTAAPVTITIPDDTVESVEHAITITDESENTNTTENTTTTSLINATENPTTVSLINTTENPTTVSLMNTTENVTKTCDTVPEVIVVEDSVNKTVRKIRTLEEYLRRVPDKCCSSLSRRIRISERRLFERNFKKLLPSEESVTICKLTSDDLTEHNFLNPQVFDEMELIGQFNKSFIITKLTFPEVKSKYNFSLYVIDQHAADEKARFERLNKTVKINKQRLIYPKLIELSPFLTQVAENSMNVLLSNGFDVRVCREKEFLVFNDEDLSMTSAYTEKIGRGVYVHTLPQILGKVLGEDDFVDFLNELSATEYVENSKQSEFIWGLGNTPRPHKIWSILASRACKSSVRAGDGLTNGQMKNIVRRMGTLIHPWNCPHGRPSIKCLVSHQQLEELLSKQ